MLADSSSVSISSISSIRRTAAQHAPRLPALLQTRCTAVETLHHAVLDISDLQQVLPCLADTVQLLVGLMDDPNFKVRPAPHAATTPVQCAAADRSMAVTGIEH